MGPRCLMEERDGTPHRRMREKRKRTRNERRERMRKREKKKGRVIYVFIS